MRQLVDAGADKDKAGLKGVTPLWMASQNGQHEVVRLLVEAGADKDKARDTDGVTPLWMASQNGHLEVVRLLVEKGADKDIANNHRVTPLSIARRQHRDGIVEMLQRAGATG